MRALITVLLLFISATAGLSQERFKGEAEFVKELLLQTTIDCPSLIKKQELEHNGEKHPGWVMRDDVFIKSIRGEFLVVEHTNPKPFPKTPSCRGIQLGVEAGHVIWAMHTGCKWRYDAHAPTAYFYDPKGVENYGEHNIPYWQMMLGRFTGLFRKVRKVCEQTDNGPTEHEKRFAEKVHSHLATPPCSGFVTEVPATEPSIWAALTFRKEHEAIDLYDGTARSQLLLNFRTSERYAPENSCRQGTILLSLSEKRLLTGAFAECGASPDGKVRWETAYRYDPQTKQVQNKHLLSQWLLRGELALAAMDEIAALYRK